MKVKEILDQLDKYGRPFKELILEDGDRDLCIEVIMDEWEVVEIKKFGLYDEDGEILNHVYTYGKIELLAKEHLER